MVESRMVGMESGRKMVESGMVGLWKDRCKDLSNLKQIWAGLWAEDGSITVGLLLANSSLVNGMTGWTFLTVAQHGTTIIKRCPSHFVLLR